MIKLQEILEFANWNGACEAQLKPFTSFIESGDELSAWQTVLGNIEWLRRRGLEIDQSFLEENAQGIEKCWQLNGQLKHIYTYKNGELDGLHQRWYSNGQLSHSYSFKAGKRDGLYQEWYEDGHLKYSYNYKKGMLDGLYQIFSNDGVLQYSYTYKNDIID